MKFSVAITALLPWALSVAAYSNIALRYDQVVKRYANDSIVQNFDAATPSSASVITSSQIVTEVPTIIATTDAQGSPTTIWATETITYYTTLHTSTEEIPVSDGTITSVIIETVTLNSAQAQSMRDTNTKSNSQTTATSTDGQGNVLQIVNKNGQVATETVSSVPSSSSNNGIITVTETVYPSTCQDVTFSTAVVKVPVLATFTVTGSQGELYTVSASTDVELTSTVTVDITSTAYSAATDLSTIYTTTASTTTYGINGTDFSVTASPEQETIDVAKRSNFDFFY